jgi:sortase A
LQDITIGDKFTTTAANNTDQSYQVSSIEIIDTAKQDIYIQDNQPQLILVTCYPFNAVVAGGTLRYVVISELIG